ncbi:hypothetical protein PITC_090770 [Penicillium italicum]|uniref:Uncharacterized protein n=1 Tax=Penicillium italicum TaxID=40296 RepID=A0A0A2LBZ2_PENIT|nr:hypothetical protein PITC_090770 [Penicillium italicum]
MNIAFCELDQFDFTYLSAYLPIYGDNNAKCCFALQLPWSVPCLWPCWSCTTSHSCNTAVNNPKPYTASSEFLAFCIFQVSIRLSKAVSEKRWIDHLQNEHAVRRNSNKQTFLSHNIITTREP